MKRIFTLILYLCLLTGLYAQNRAIRFEKGTLRETLDKAKTMGKTVFVDCYTTYCGPCKMMAQTVFKTDSVADFFNQNFVNLQLDMLSEDGKKYAGTYKIGAYPTFLLLKPDGEVMYKFVGGMDARKFMVQIRKGMNPHNQEVLMDRTYASGKYSDDFTRNYIRLKLKLFEKEEAIKLSKDFLEKKTPVERTSKDNWFLFTDRTLAGVHTDNMLYLLRHWNEFTKTIGQEIVYDRIRTIYRNITEWVLQGWYEKETGGKPEDMVQLKKLVTAIPLPDQSDYRCMMDICHAAMMKQDETVRKLFMEHLTTMSEPNQVIILYDGMNHFTSGSKELDELARKYLKEGKNKNVINFMKTLLPENEAYTGEKYDVPNLKDKIGSTVTIPFFHPTKDKFWYCYEDRKGQRHYFRYEAGKGKSEMYDKAIIDSLIAHLFTGKEVSTFYSPEFNDSDVVAKVEVDGKSFRYDAQSRSLIPYNSRPYPYIREYGLSPDFKYKVSSEQNNLWLENTTTHHKIQWTNDGSPHNTFETGDIEWLSDSCFYITRTDTRSVRDFYLVRSSGEPAPTLTTYRYELPGDTGVTKKQLFIGNVRSGQLTKVHVDLWQGQLLDIVKTPDVNDKVFFWRKKRTRDEAQLCTANARTGAVKVIIDEISKPYLNEDLFGCHIVNKGKDIFLWSDRTGWGHYYHYSGSGKLLNAVTKGNWTAGRILDIDTIRHTIYLKGFGREQGRNPNYEYVYKTDFNGKRLKLLTPENATHNSSYISPSRHLLVDNFSRIDTIPQTVVRTTDGKLLATLEKTDVSGLLAYGWKYPEQFTVKAADGVTDLYGIMWKPYDFNPHKKYPIISQVYPGPQTETVWTGFTVFDKYNNTALAQRGFIVVCFGHRGGSPFRSKSYATYGYGNLRDYALADDKYGLEQLARRYTYIDSTRIGIYGHSGGGMMALAALCTYPDFYKVAVSSSGNHDNSIYNRTWGETYQGIGEDNKFSVATNQELVRYMKGHLLLVTGEMDNNVHPANTMRVVNELIHQDKKFDLLILPDQDHHYQEPYKSYFEKAKRDYFCRYLTGDAPGK